MFISLIIRVVFKELSLTTVNLPTAMKCLHKLLIPKNYFNEASSCKILIIFLFKYFLELL